MSEEADAELKAESLSAETDSQPATAAGQKRKAEPTVSNDDEEDVGGKAALARQNGSGGGGGGAPAKRPRLLASSELRPATDRTFFDLVGPADGDSNLLAGVKARLLDFSADAIRLVARPGAFCRFLAASPDRLSCCLAGLLADPDGDANDAPPDAGDTEVAVDLMSACFSRLLIHQVRHLPVQHCGGSSGGGAMPSLRPIRIGLTEVNRVAKDFGFRLSASAGLLAENFAALSERLPPPQLNRATTCRSIDWTEAPDLLPALLKQLPQLTESKIELPSLRTIPLPYNVVSGVRDSIAACFLTYAANVKVDDSEDSPAVWHLERSIARVRAALADPPRDLERKRAAAVAASAAWPKPRVQEKRVDVNESIGADVSESTGADVSESTGADVSESTGADEAAAVEPTSDETSDEAPKQPAEFNPDAPVDPQAEAAAKAAAEAKAAVIAYVRPALAAGFIECLVMLNLTPYSHRRLTAAEDIHRRLDEARSFAEAFDSADQVRPILDAIAESLLESSDKPDLLGQLLGDDRGDALRDPKTDALPDSVAEELLKFRGQPPAAWLRRNRLSISHLVADFVASPSESTSLPIRLLIDETLTRCRGTKEWSHGMACVNSGLEIGVLCCMATKTPISKIWPSESELRRQLLSAATVPPGILDESNLRRICLAAFHGRQPAAPAYTVRLEADIVDNGPEATVSSAAFADRHLDWRLGRRYGLLEFSIHRPLMPTSKPASTDGDGGGFHDSSSASIDIKAVQSSVDPDVASKAGALAMWASRFGFVDWSIFSGSLLYQAVVEYLATTDESVPVALATLSATLNEFWSGILERIVGDRRSKLSVPYMRSLLAALAEIKTIASEIVVEPGLETVLKNITLVTSWTDASCEKFSRRVGVFRAFERDCLTALMQCHRETLDIRPSHAVVLTDKHMATYHSMRRLVDTLFHYRDYFAFVSCCGGYEILAKQAPRDVVCSQLLNTALLESLFWYRLRLRLCQPGEHYRYSLPEAKLRARGMRDFVKAFCSRTAPPRAGGGGGGVAGNVVSNVADWLEATIVEVLTEDTE